MNSVIFILVINFFSCGLFAEHISDLTETGSMSVSGNQSDSDLIIQIVTIARESGIDLHRFFQVQDELEKARNNTMQSTFELKKAKKSRDLARAYQIDKEIVILSKKEKDARKNFEVEIERLGAATGHLPNLRIHGSSDPDVVSPLETLPP